jgi:hypothetical protein
VPIFAFQSSQAPSAVLTLSRDYYESGRAGRAHRRARDARRVAGDDSVRRRASTK